MPDGGTRCSSHPTRCIRHPDTAKHGFHYVDWLFEEDNLIVASRTAWDEAHNFHDANYLTFHRIRDFRR